MKNNVDGIHIEVGTYTVVQTENDGDDNNNIFLLQAKKHKLQKELKQFHKSTI